MSAVGTGSEVQTFVEGKALPEVQPSATGGETAKYESAASGPMKGGNRFKRGSRAAKEFMAKLRSMRKSRKSDQGSKSRKGSQGGKSMKGGKSKKGGKSMKVRGGNKGLLGTLEEDVVEMVTGDTKGDTKVIKEAMEADAHTNTEMIQKSASEGSPLLEEGEEEMKKLIPMMGGKKAKSAKRAKRSRSAKKRFWFFK
jgi:hypothetical protein